jgi:hypothetical protein
MSSASDAVTARTSHGIMKDVPSKHLTSVVCFVSVLLAARLSEVTGWPERNDFGFHTTQLKAKAAFKLYLFIIHYV